MFGPQEINSFVLSFPNIKRSSDLHLLSQINFPESQNGKTSEKFQENKICVNRCIIIFLLNLTLLLQDLLNLVLSAKLVKEVARQSWDVFQLANALDSIMQVSVLLQDIGRLRANRR